MKKDDHIFLQTNRKMELTSDILLPSEENGSYENFYSEFADTMKDPKKELNKDCAKVKNEQTKTKLEPVKAETSIRPTQASSLNLLDSIFSSQNMLFKSSNKVEINK